MLQAKAGMAFAGEGCQSSSIVDLHMPTADFDRAIFLQFMRKDRNAGALNPKHLGKKRLRDLQFRSVSNVAGTQKPSGETLRDEVAGIACCGLLGLYQKKLFMSEQHCSGVRVIRGNLDQIGGTHQPAGSRYLPDIRAYVRRRAKSRGCAYKPITPNHCRLNTVAVSQVDNNGHKAGAREEYIFNLPAGLPKRISMRVRDVL
jgi:hypothetical protein